MNRKVPLGRGKPLARSGGLARGGPLRLVGDKRLAAGEPIGLRRSPLAPVSDKRRAENRQRRAMADALFGGEPQPCGITVRRADAGMLPLAICTGWADDIHEALTRARGGSITDPSIWILPCRPCHTWVTDRPERSELKWAYELGILIHSWDAPPLRGRTPLLPHITTRRAGTREQPARRKAGTMNAITGWLRRVPGYIHHGAAAVWQALDPVPFEPPPVEYERDTPDLTDSERAVFAAFEKRMSRMPAGALKRGRQCSDRLRAAAPHLPDADIARVLAWVVGRAHYHGRGPLPPEAAFFALTRDLVVACADLTEMARAADVADIAPGAGSR